MQMKVSLDIESCETILFMYYQMFKGRLLNGLIHNVGSHLQSIIFLVQLLDVEDNRSSEGSQTHINAIYNALNNISDIFDDFRILDQMTDNREKTLNLGEVYRLFSRILKADLFFKHNISLEIRSGGESIFPEIPSRMFLLVFVELVNNALKALSRVDGEKKLIFDVRITGEQQTAVIRIGDSGCGWSSDADPLDFFKPSYFFWPPVEVRVGEKPSLGLGLYCARELVGQYGGTISLSRSDSISWVELTLPIYPVI